MKTTVVTLSMTLLSVFSFSQTENNQEQIIVPENNNNGSQSIDETIQPGGESTVYDPMKENRNANRAQQMEEGGETTVFDPLKNDKNEMRSMAQSNSELTEEDVVLYPNPAQDILMVQCNGQNPNSVEIYDLSGKLVLQQDTREIPGNQIRLQVDQLPRGAYVLLLRYNPITLAKKTVLF